MTKIKKSPLDSDVIKYITDNGFGEPTPDLNTSLSAQVFRQHYYDKKVLMAFCREVGISTRGLKEDLNKRIEVYLRTGRLTLVQSVKQTTRPDSETGLSLDKVVVNYKSDLKTRQFFASQIKEFTGFSALVQKQIRQLLADGESFTYGDAIKMHKTFLRNKANARQLGQVTTVAHDSCQYNQFSIDYKHDSSPKLHNLTDAWDLVRNSAGAKTYKRYKDRIEEIRAILMSKVQV